MARTTVDVTLVFTVELSATMERCDYGVPGSPVWYEPTDEEVESVAYEERSYTFEEFSAEWGERLAGVVAELACEQAENWENEEPEYEERDDE